MNVEAQLQQYGQIKAVYDAAKAGYENLKNSVEPCVPTGTIIGRHFNEVKFIMVTDGWCCCYLLWPSLGMMKIEVMVPEQEFV